MNFGHYSHYSDRRSAKLQTPVANSRPDRPRLYKDALWRSLVSRTPLVITDTATGITYNGVVNGIRAEDGSGSSFLVTLHSTVEVTIYHRTCD